MITLLKRLSVYGRCAGIALVLTLIPALMPSAPITPQAAAQSVGSVMRSLATNQLLYNRGYSYGYGSGQPNVYIQPAYGYTLPYANGYRSAAYSNYGNYGNYGQAHYGKNHQGCHSGNSPNASYNRQLRQYQNSPFYVSPTHRASIMRF